MINKIINLPYHIKFDIPYLLNQTSYIHAIIYNQMEENDIAYIYSQKEFILSFDASFNIISKEEFNINSECKIVSCDNKKIIIRIDSNGSSKIKYISKNKEEIIDIEFEDKCYSDDDYFVIQRNENIYKIFDNEFRVIEKNIDINKIKNDFYGITSQIFIEKNYPNCFRFLYKKIQNKKIYFLENREINNEILIVENNINKSISIAKVQDYYIYDFYFYNNIIYLLYLNMNKGNDYKLIEIDEANNKNVTNLKAYSCQLVCINNTVCLICDLPKNYTASQKKLKNQELMGNSTIMVLK